MNDFDALLVRVVDQARSLGIPVSRRIDPHVGVNRRAVSRFGCCIRRGDGSFAIAHEVLHTCPGCRNHGPRWKAWAARMNQAWGYAIARTGTCGELGVEDVRPVRHLVVCTRCHREFPRMKRSPLVDHPERYRCRCGGTLERKF